MKRNTWITGLLAVLIVFTTARADFVPNYISYEGTVLDEFGKPGTGTRDLIFTLIDTNNYRRWFEIQPSVPLDSQGAFQVLLGKIYTLPILDPTWRMTVELLPASGARKPLTPPQAMSSVFYAMQVGDARKAPGDLTVSEQLRVDGELKVTGLLSATRLNTEEVTAGTVRAKRLSVSDLSGKASGPIAVESNMELTKGLTVKGPVSMMRVLDFTADMATNLSGRVYLLAPKNQWNLSFIRKFPPSGDILKSDLYEYTLPNHFFFLPLDMTPGEKLVFYGYASGEELQEIPPALLTTVIKIVKMGY